MWFVVCLHQIIMKILMGDSIMGKWWLNFKTGKFEYIDNGFNYTRKRFVLFGSDGIFSTKKDKKQTYRQEIPPEVRYELEQIDRQAREKEEMRRRAEEEKERELELLQEKWKLEEEEWQRQKEEEEEERRRQEEEDEQRQREDDEWWESMMEEDDEY